MGNTGSVRKGAPHMHGNVSCTRKHGRHYKTSLHGRHYKTRRHMHGRSRRHRGGVGSRLNPNSKPDETSVNKSGKPVDSAFLLKELLRTRSFKTHPSGPKRNTRALSPPRKSASRSRKPLVRQETIVEEEE
jgi:hypothetical protein